MKTERLANFPMWCMTLLRMVLGWHFLYEGLWKLCVAQKWSAVEYLRMSHWIGADFFSWIASHPGVLATCNTLMELGLVAIGLGLITGVLARYAAGAGVLLLALFYIAYPPFMIAGGDNHFLLVNYNVIEALALVAVIALPGPGLWTVCKACFARRAKSRGEEVPDSPERREVIAGLASLPALALLGGAHLAKHGLPKKGQGVEAVTSASYRFEFQHIGDLKKKFAPKGEFGGLEAKTKVKMSRVVLGGNLIGGWAHSRDLMYVSQLMKAYNTPRRIYDTLHLAEACGFDTIMTNPSLMDYITRYWKDEGGKIQFISDCGGAGGPVLGAKKSVDAGACSVYIIGEQTDVWTREGKWKEMENYLVEARKLGVPVGIGAHDYSSIKGCVEHDIIPDYWMKTFHSTNYWSAKHPQRNDNIWCPNPDEVAEFFAARKEPFIAFKTMAAGAIHPKDAIPFVFEKGADFACMGMFDFQVVEDANLVNDIFDKGFAKRTRPWCAPNA